MFSWTEDAKVSTPQPYPEVVTAVRDYLEDIGATADEGRGEIGVTASRYNAFGYDCKITAKVREGRNSDYRVEVTYEIIPNALGIVLCVLFWPLALVLFLMGSTTKQNMRKAINHVLEDVETNFGKSRDD